MEGTEEFIIKNKPVYLKIFLATLITSIALAVMFVLIVVIYGVDKRVEAIWAVLMIPVFSLVVSIFGLFIYYKEAFMFKDDAFTYIKILKKPQSVKAEEIDFVIIRSFGLMRKVQFINKRAEVALSFIDDGTAFQDGKFLNTLTELNILVKIF